MPIERRYQRIVQRYLNEASRRYVARVREQLRGPEVKMQKAAIFDWASILASTIERGYVLESLGRFQNALWTISTNDAVRELYRFAQVDLPEFVINTNEIRDRIVNQMADRITETTTAQVQETVMTGINDGLGVEEIADRIQTSSTFNRARSRMIAQTETNRTINEARQAGWEELTGEAQRAGITIEIKKEWITSSSGARPLHEDLDGAVVGLNEEFTIQGYHAHVPGGFGVGSMDINCRCTVRSIIID